MKRTPPDGRLQRLFERMADRYEGTLELVSWRKRGQEAVLHMESCSAPGIVSQGRFTMSLKIMFEGMDEPDVELVEITRLGLTPLGRWMPEKKSRVLVTPNPSAILAVALR